MNAEQMHGWGIAVKEWSAAAFYVAGTVMCATAAYRFLFA